MLAQESSLHHQYSLRYWGLGHLEAGRELEKLPNPVTFPPKLQSTQTLNRQTMHANFNNIGTRIKYVSPIFIEILRFGRLGSWEPVGTASQPCNF